MNNLGSGPPIPPCNSFRDSATRFTTPLHHELLNFHNPAFPHSTIPLMSEQPPVNLVTDPIASPYFTPSMAAAKNDPFYKFGPVFGCFLSLCFKCKTKLPTHRLEVCPSTYYQPGTWPSVCEKCVFLFPSHCSETCPNVNFIQKSSLRIIRHVDELNIEHQGMKRKAGLAVFPVVGDPGTKPEKLPKRRSSKKTYCKKSTLPDHEKSTPDKDCCIPSIDMICPETNLPARKQRKILREMRPHGAESFPFDLNKINSKAERTYMLTTESDSDSEMQKMFLPKKPKRKRGREPKSQLKKEEKGTSQDNFHGADKDLNGATKEIVDEQSEVKLSDAVSEETIIVDTDTELKDKESTSVFVEYDTDECKTEHHSLEEPKDSEDVGQHEVVSLGNEDKEQNAIKSEDLEGQHASEQSAKTVDDISKLPENKAIETSKDAGDLTKKKMIKELFDKKHVENNLGKESVIGKTGETFANDETKDDIKKDGTVERLYEIDSLDGSNVAEKSVKRKYRKRRVKNTSTKSSASGKAKERKAAENHAMNNYCKKSANTNIIQDKLIIDESFEKSITEERTEKKLLPAKKNARKYVKKKKDIREESMVERPINKKIQRMRNAFEGATEEEENNVEKVTEKKCRKHRNSLKRVAVEKSAKHYTSNNKGLEEGNLEPRNETAICTEVTDGKQHLDSEIVIRSYAEDCSARARVLVQDIIENIIASIPVESAIEQVKRLSRTSNN